MSQGRADHGSAKASYMKAKKIIFASQSVCGICGRPVDFSKKFPDPWSATIDHIIPVSKGGAPASIENMQLAHSYCNRQKSTKLVELQIKEKSVSNRDLPLSMDWSTL
jgi:5-methylcytosine-specific restriction endonuclease McrA